MEILEFANPAAWDAWLAEHGKSCDGLWLRLARKGSDLTTVTYAEALEEALCHGWIDGQKKGESEQAWLQKFTPRRARSLWSVVNRNKALALIEQGRMRAAGLAEVERAQQDGRWEAAYASPSQITVPEELQQALDGNPIAASFFATLSSANRYAVLWRIHTAKKPETKQRRTEQILAMLARGETFH